MFCLTSHHKPTIQAREEKLELREITLWSFSERTKQLTKMPLEHEATGALSKKDTDYISCRAGCDGFKLIYQLLFT